MTAPSDFNGKIIAEFRASEGAVGGPFAGSGILLLHHTGARSGLIAHPEASVEIGTDTVPVKARLAEPAERDVIWDRQIERAPHFAQYQQKAHPRKIPVIVLDPVK